MATTTADDWERAAAEVAGAETVLRGADTATVRAWAGERGLMTAALWPKIKRELYKQFGTDYEGQREREERSALDTVAARAADPATPIVELFTAGSAQGRFGVVGTADDTAWYGTFHPKDSVYRRGDQDSADNSAAGKAVFLAAKARTDLRRPDGDHTVVRLVLHISNPHVDRDRLTAIAAAHAVFLSTVDVVPTGDNPAAVYCDLPGHRAWQHVRLSDLITAPDAGAPEPLIAPDAGIATDTEAHR